MEKPSTSQRQTGPKKVDDEVKFTGGNFMNYDDLVAIVQAYQQRQKLCEDVDELEKQGGKD